MVLRAGDPIVTFVARNLEPYRGFHIFMRALQKIQQAHPTCHALIVGGDAVSYGKRPKDAPTWREQMLIEVKLDPQRTHFLGRLPHATYLRVLQLSAAHVYLTYPFVLSWSLLEAMGCGVPIVGSDTAPVHEVLRDGENARLVPFFDERAIARNVVEMMQTRRAQVPMRKQARADAQRFSLQAGLAGYERVVCAGVQTAEADRPVLDRGDPGVGNAAGDAPASGSARAGNAQSTSPIEFNDRDRELVQWLRSGHSTKQIATMRNRSPATVRNQLSALCQKLGVERRSDAVAKIIEQRLREAES